MKRVLLTLLSLFICLEFWGCAQGRASSSGTAPPKAAAMQPSPSVAPPSDPEEWFIGDWAGICINELDPLVKPLTDFGAALPFDGMLQRICLVRISTAKNGYTAELGNSRWELTAYNDTGFSMRCTSSGGVQWDNYRFFVGEVLSFTYTENLPSSVEGALVPTEEILRGATQTDTACGSTAFMLARLPSAEVRSDQSGLYPHWCGGYENSSGPVKGLFCLGADKWGNAYFGAYIHRAGQSDLIPLATTLAGMTESTRVILPYENGFDGLVEGQRLYGAPSLYWPLFFSFYEGNHSYGFYEDVTQEHRDYFASVYPSMLDCMEAQLPAMPGDIWAQRKHLAIKGLRHYAALAASGALEDALLSHVPKLLLLEKEYLPEVELAGLKPGSTLADAKRLYALRRIDADTAYALGFGLGDGGGSKPLFTDGKGIILRALEDGRIDAVYLYASGYQTPDGRQVGGEYFPETGCLYGQDARITYFSSGSASEGGRPIESISMRCVLDCVWSATEVDIDGDSEKEYLTLSGRSSDDFPEYGTVLFDRDTKLALPSDFGTKTTLKVYKNGVLTEETTLPLCLYLLPHFFYGEASKGQVRIWCDSGGNSAQQPAYLVEKTEEGWRTTFLGDLSN